jgi:hypothetical protein
MVNLSNFGLIATFLLAVGALWVALSRFSVQTESNWPLVFYGGLTLWFFSYSVPLNPMVLYTAIVCGLLLRFEFLNQRLILLVRFIELILLMMIAWTLFQLLLSEL